MAGGGEFTSVGMGVSGFSLEYRNYKKLHDGLGRAKRSEGFRVEAFGVVRRPTNTQEGLD